MNTNNKYGTTYITKDFETLDIKKGLHMIDGTRAHGVLPFSGERYSVVFYATNRYQQLTQEAVETLVTRARSDAAYADTSKPGEDGEEHCNDVAG